MFVELKMRSPYQIFDKLDDASESEKQEKVLSFTLTVVSLRTYRTQLRQAYVDSYGG